MIVCEVPSGRLGNAIFRYMAGAIFLYNYENSERVTYIDGLHNITRNTIIINDHDFLSFMNNYEKNGIFPDLNTGAICVFNGYFQFDLYKKYRKQILKYMKSHKDHELFCTDYKNGEKFYVKDILKFPKTLPPLPKYNIVVHVRLEDFIFNKHVIHPAVLKKILKELTATDSDAAEKPNICLISNKPTKIIEFEYLSYFMDKFNISFQTNDIITDFHIMCNAKILVCSHSTISWCAAILSKHVEKVYIPDQVMHSHQSFSQPHDNTVRYKNRVCGEDELREYFAKHGKKNIK